MTETPTDLRCSFCNRSESEVSQLVAGPRVYICDACVAIAGDIISHAKRPPSESGPQLLRWLKRARHFVRPGRRAKHRSVVEALRA